MTLAKALEEIKTFWNNDKLLPFGESDNSAHVARLNEEFGVTLSGDLLEYVKNYAPAETFDFSTVGNPMDVYGIDKLKFKQDGFSYNPVKQEMIGDWPANLFIFGDEGADPVVYDLQQENPAIVKLMHGAGSWDYGEAVGDTIGQFLLCSAAQHHALWDFVDEPIEDDYKNFKLTATVAEWYFPRMKKWAGKYYEAWCSVFDNS